MSFHPQKCYTLSATRKKKKIVPSYQLHGHNLQNVSTAKYLGINIQDNLNWGPHIDTITNKANKTLGFLRRNLKIGNKKTKETAYKAFVRPILEYSATVWDPHTANDIKTIEKVQRRAARWVTNRHHQTSCVNSIIDSLAWPTLQQRRKKARLEIFVKFHHRLVTIDSEYLPQPTENRSSHRKNNTHSYNIPYCRTQYRQMSFFPRTIPEWNSLPQEIVAAKSLDCFKSRLAAHL